MRQSRVEDVLYVLNEMKRMFSLSGGTADFGELRQKAIEVIARRELQSGRFKHGYSAQKSIHDACTRRLKTIGNVYNFERAAKEWLRDCLKTVVRA